MCTQADSLPSSNTSQAVTAHLMVLEKPSPALNTRSALINTRTWQTWDHWLISNAYKYEGRLFRPVLTHPSSSASLAEAVTTCFLRITFPSHGSVSLCQCWNDCTELNFHLGNTNTSLSYQYYYPYWVLLLRRYHSTSSSCTSVVVLLYTGLGTTESQSHL